MKYSIRAFSSGVPNAKYLAFGIPDTKNSPLWGVLNVLELWDMLQYALKYESVQTGMR